MQRRTIGLFGAIATLVGFVIGATVFILPAELAQQAGPGVVFSFAIAGLMAMFSCVIGAQVGTVFPVSGASFIATARLTGTYMGFIYIWLILIGVAIGIAVVALGFAMYFSDLFPAANQHVVAVLCIVSFTLVNLKGVNLTVTSQAVMVFVFMLVLVIFSYFAWPNIDVNLLEPVAPNGVSAVLSAAIPAYFSFIGFLVIIEIGGEIKRPKTTIPLALMISFIIVLCTYLSVSISIVGVLDWSTLSETKAPFSTISQQIHSVEFSRIVVITILIAAASSINGLLFSFSRDLMMLARIGLMPRNLGLSSTQTGQPNNAIITLSIVSIGIVLIGADIREYAVVTVFGLMFGQILLSITALRIPAKCNDAFSNNAFKLNPISLYFFAVGLIILSCGFLAISAYTSPLTALVSIVIVIAGSVYYRLRRRYLTQHGVKPEELIRQASTHTE